MLVVFWIVLRVFENADIWVIFWYEDNFGMVKVQTKEKINVFFELEFATFGQEELLMLQMTLLCAVFDLMFPVLLGIKTEEGVIWVSYMVFLINKNL